MNFTDQSHHPRIAGLERQCFLIELQRPMEVRVLRLELPETNMAQACEIGERVRVAAATDEGPKAAQKKSLFAWR